MSARKGRLLGRPTKLTPAFQEALLQRLELGLSLTMACHCVGVSRSAVYGWLARGQGRDPERPATKKFVDFVGALKKAQAVDIERRVQRIDEAAKGGMLLYRKESERTDKKTGDVIKTIEERFAPPCWTADAWHLERTYPEHWGNHKREIAELKKELEQVQRELERLTGAKG
jgi:uncharacterized protein with von Willebrand factor type A (vWA) domain